MADSHEASLVQTKIRPYFTFNWTIENDVLDHHCNIKVPCIGCWMLLWIQLVSSLLFLLVWVHNRTQNSAAGWSWSYLNNCINCPDFPKVGIKLQFSSQAKQLFYLAAGVKDLQELS